MNFTDETAKTATKGLSKDELELLSKIQCLEEITTIMKARLTSCKLQQLEQFLILVKTL